MRYIKIVGSKQHPVIKQKSENIKKNSSIIINKINKELKEGQIYLYLVGENLKQNYNYNWEILFDNESIIPSSIGTTLILSKSNSLKYLNADKVSAKIKVNDYISQVFDL